MTDVMLMEGIHATAKRLGVNLSSIDLDSIRLPRVKNLWIVSDDEDLEEEKPLEFEEVFGNIIVLNNLPVKRKEKAFPLEFFVRKYYEQFGVIKEGGLWMPTDADTRKTLGYCFIEYNTLQEAEIAKENTDGFKRFYRPYVCAVTNMLDDIEKLMKVPKDWALGVIAVRFGRFSTKFKPI